MQAIAVYSKRLGLNAITMRSAADLIDHSTAEDLVTYEQPLNERMRTFLRLSFLLDQAEFHAQGSSTWQSRAAVATLTEETVKKAGRAALRLQQAIRACSGLMGKYTG